MSVKFVASRENPGFRELHALATDRRARKREGQTLLDGAHLIEAALAARVRISRLILSETALAGALSEWPQRHPEIPVWALSDSLFAQLSPVDTPTGLIAVADIPIPGDGTEDFIVLLEDIRDPGNLGAILRVAAAAGVQAVHLSKGCTEAWSPKCLRGGQGGHFLLNIHEDVDLAELAGRFSGPVHAATLGAGISLFDLCLAGSVGFAFGNEGAGLSPSLRQAALPFSIPMPGRVESLNVATAAAVCLFERVRQLAGG